MSHTGWKQGVVAGVLFSTVVLAGTGARAADTASGGWNVPAGSPANGWNTPAPATATAPANVEVVPAPVPVAIAQPVPTFVVPPDLAPPPPRRSHPMLNWGIGLLASGYGVGLGTGLVLLLGSGSTAAGGVQFIPVLGPLISPLVLGNYGSGFYTASSLLIAAVQITGTALIIADVVQHRAPPPVARYGARIRTHCPTALQLTLTPWATTDAGGLALVGVGM